MITRASNGAVVPGGGIYLVDLRKVRRDKGMSQYALARKAKVSQVLVQAAEEGQRIPTRSAVRISEALGRDLYPAGR